jgi:hypothetical protein
MPPRNSTDFLELAKNCSFLDRKPSSVKNQTPDDNKPFPPRKGFIP